MKFLCDVHIPYKLITLLKEKGCEALHINAIFSDPKTSDATIIQYADNNNFIVITKDADFKESYLLYGKPNKLIKLNTGNSSTQQILGLFERNWQILLLADQRATFYIESDLINFFLIDTEI